MAAVAKRYRVMSVQQARVQAGEEGPQEQHARRPVGLGAAQRAYFQREAKQWRLTPGDPEAADWPTRPGPEYKDHIDIKTSQYPPASHTFCLSSGTTRRLAATASTSCSNNQRRASGVHDKRNFGGIG